MAAINAIFSMALLTLLEDPASKTWAQACVATMAKIVTIVGCVEEVQMALLVRMTTDHQFGDVRAQTSPGKIRHA